MRRSCVGAVFAFLMVAGVLQAQSTLDFPYADPQPYSLDSTTLTHKDSAAAVVYEDAIHIEGAGSMRLYFDHSTTLAPGSFIRITAMQDGEEQVFDFKHLAEWNFSSAYFNGEEVVVELIAAPGTSNRVVISQVASEDAVQIPAGSCGICGADTRTPSNEDWSARLLPAGCTASIYNTDSCMVSAGHCVDGTSGDVVQFRVPASGSDCTLRHPPVADQFPITARQFQNAGVGADWSALRSGTNNLGQTIFDRYGELMPLATSPPSVGNAVNVWGFGVDDQCTRNQVQQVDTDPGTVRQVLSTYFRHETDATFGNSGSGIIRSGQILGINTHCPCWNYATRIDLAAFVAAREEICGGGGGPDNDDCSEAEAVSEGAHAFSTVGATTDGPTLPQSCDEGFGLSLVSDVWYAYTPTCTGDATVDLCNSDYDTRMAVYNDGSCPGSFLDCNDDACGTQGLRSEVTFPVMAGVAVLVRVGGFSAQGAGTMVISCDGVSGPPNDDCADSIPINDGDTAFSTLGATTDGPPLPGGCDEGFGIDFVNDVWYHYSASCTGTVTVSTCDQADFDTRLAAYMDNDCPGSFWACNDDGEGCGDFTSLMQFQAGQGMGYLLRLGGFDGSGSGTLSVSCDPVGECQNDPDCDNGLFCDGAERCIDNTCVDGTPPDCSDPVGCTVDSCNEGTDSCDNIPDDGLCDNGLFCDGAETCDPDLDCQAGTPPDCSDTVGCTNDVCNEGTDSCDNIPDDGLCDNEQFCDGAETCDAEDDCQAGTPPDCNDNVGCTIDSCNEGTDACDHDPDNGLCDNGQYCDGSETCDAEDDCQPGTDPCLPEEICDEANDVCVDCLFNEQCDDGLFCNGAELCSDGACLLGIPVDCTDDVGCTNDSCNEGTDSCDNLPDDGLCDNGLYCDGAETCDAETDCQSGTPPDCSDTVGCTVDSCNEGSDSCDNIPDDGLCDNEQFCDGAETCDAEDDCQAGTPPDCNDDVGCTNDSCNEGSDVCDHIPDDGLCDNEQFCDGTETCDAEDDCQPGTPVDCPQGQECDEELDMCVEVIDCPEDLDGSGAIDFGDVLKVLSAWGPCQDCPEDLDDSGSVDFGDVLQVLSAWGPCP